MKNKLKENKVIIFLALLAIVGPFISAYAGVQISLIRDNAVIETKIENNKEKIEKHLENEKLKDDRIISILMEIKEDIGILKGRMEIKGVKK